MNIAHLREIEKWHLLENESNQRARENLVNRFAPVEATRCRPHLGKVYTVDTLPPQIPAPHSTGVMEHGDFWWKAYYSSILHASIRWLDWCGECQWLDPPPSTEGHHLNSIHSRNVNVLLLVQEALGSKLPNFSPKNSPSPHCRTPCWPSPRCSHSVTRNICRLSFTK